MQEETKASSQQARMGEVHTLVCRTGSDEVVGRRGGEEICGETEP